jgi:hypothetical protein
LTFVWVGLIRMIHCQKGKKTNNSTMKGYVVSECLRWNQVNEFRMNLSFPILNLLIERNENMLQSAPI